MSDSKRWPKRVYEVGSEPDPRFTLANERTFLAWIRSALALIAAGVAIEELQVGHNPTLRGIAAATLILIGATFAIFAFFRWMSIERAMRETKPLPSLLSGLGIAVFVVVAAVLVSLLLLT